MESTPAHRGQRLTQFITLAVVPDRSDGQRAAHAQRHKVVQHRAERTRVRPHADHLIRGEPRFHGRLVAGRVDVQVAIQEQIPDQADGAAGDRGENAFDEQGVEHIRVIHFFGANRARPSSTSFTSFGSVVRSDAMNAFASASGHCNA